MRSVLLATVLGGLALSISCGARTGLPGLGFDDGLGGSDGVGGDPGPTVGPIATATSTGDGGGGNDGGGGQNEGGGPIIEECDPDVLFIYLVTSGQQLLRFDPATLTTELVGTPSCPSAFSPFSMAVSRSGRAFSIWGFPGDGTGGDLFRINVKNAACAETDWVPGTSGFQEFGMGYAIDDDGQGETLYVAEINFAGPSAGLARLDTETFDLDFIGPFSINPGSAIELTSSDDGELYGYFLNDGGGGTLVRIDKETAEIVEAVGLPVPAFGGTSLAFAYWNGDFYIFTGDGAVTEVNRYRPSEGTTTLVTTLQDSVVGAGVSTCDPDEARGAPRRD